MTIELTDADKPDPELVYRDYFETCRRLGVKPTAQGRAEALIKAWTKVFTAAFPEPPARH